MRAELVALTGRPRVSDIYDWYIQQHREVILIDIGVPDKIEPMPELEEYQPQSKPKPSRQLAYGAIRNAITDYLVANGPDIVANITQAVLYVWPTDAMPDRPNGSVNAILYSGPFDIVGKEFNRQGRAVYKWKARMP